jgi:hypothetical protein
MAGTELMLSTTDYPQIDGQIERMNRILSRVEGIKSIPHSMTSFENQYIYQY